MDTSVRDLQVGEMINISAAWVGQDKASFLAVPQIAPLYERVEAVHQALVVARDDASANAALSELTAKAEALDDRHDDLNRGLYYLLLAAQYVELGRSGGNAALAGVLHRANKTLFPEGLRSVTMSYLAEAGNAAQLNAVATSQFANELGSVHITRDLTALDLAHAIGSVGAELGAVEGQRAVAAAEAKDETITPSEVRKRMRDWAQVAEAVLVNLELATGSAETIEALQRPLLNAAEKAIERRRERRKGREDAGDKP